MSRIYDAHSHYMPTEVAQNTAFFKVGWSDVDRQLSVMDEHGIEKVLLLYPTSDAHLNMGGWGPLSEIYNSELSKVVKAHADRFSAGCIIPFGDATARDSVLKNFDPNVFKVFSIASSYDGTYLDDEYFDTGV